ncbi:MAG: endonuclease MutS2 [Thermaurantimonas sp.]|uniref:endonuclease MutS2 n=1 Tax=Thermaurantimonas sp. TaxID=2681568 RepID=UPI00391C211D
MYIYPKNLTDILEYKAIAEYISHKCVLSKAAEALRQITPNTDYQQLHAELNAVQEVMLLTNRTSGIPGLGHEDCTRAFKILKTGSGTVDEKGFMAIRQLSEAFDNVFKFLFQNRELAPMLWKLVEKRPPEPQIIALIDKVFDPRGNIKSSASSLLASIREELQRKRQQSDKLFYKIVHRLESSGILADFKESVHENRRVLAVLASHKNKVNGIFHGSSGKNMVVFVEPPETIEINNEIARLADDERREILRILTELTYQLSVFYPVLSEMEEILVHLDTLKARAAFGIETGGCVPQVMESPSVIKIVNGYNPALLLHNRQRNKPTIPLTIELNRHHRVMVISGPNAGGKSVAMKTVGLLVLMLQSGIPIPVAPESSFGLIHSIFGDIGDAQSIENELSTYSSRLNKMKHILRRMGKKSLILIDEFGSGSDPELGSAIAMVFLEEIQKSGALGVITTHFNKIKALAAQLSNVQNASMQFDRETLQPLYQLHIGAPGSSYTFEVAQNVGIPREIIDRAKEKLENSTVEVDRLLVSIQQEKQNLELQTKQLEKRLEELSKLKETQEKKIRRLEEKLEKQSEINRRQSEKLMWGSRFSQLVNMWEQNPTSANKKIISQKFWRLLQEKAAENAKKREAEATVKAETKSKNLKRLLNTPVNVGDQVKLLENNLIGQLVDVKKDKYHIRLGNMVAILDRNQFIPLITKKKKAAKQKTSSEDTPASNT